jgi:hypothetical protein
VTKREEVFVIRELIDSANSDLIHVITKPNAKFGIIERTKHDYW